MTMLEKIKAVKKAQGWRADVEEKLKEVIKSTYDCHCTGIEDFTINDKHIAVTYEYVCRGYGDVDYADIPVEWLAEGFDYKAAFEEERRKTEERRKQEAIEEQKKAEAKKTREEKKLYLKLKAKYEKRLKIGKSSIMAKAKAEKTSKLDGKKVFIAGPMRGYEKYNFPKFDRIEKVLKSHGIECVNPGRISRKFKEKDVNSDINVYNEMVRLQQEAEKTCNAILLLDGWQWSKGAALEVKTAAELGMQFLLESDIPEEWLYEGKI